ncbi:MAG: glycoside hydrolase family 38 C-terminal domain-containing protein [Victivallaceae bacterium]|nr:glycoside hydrolase family 38 C-terminal domain-containing protein [Victivallaceae bacterium]
MQNYVVPTFHYDVIYLRDSAQYNQISFAILDRALELLEKDSDYTFTVEQVILLEAYWKARPEAHEALRRFAQEGRLAFAPGMYVMPDMNLIDGESLYRQACFGGEFLERELGVRPNMCWIADCWGHHAQLPQILRQCGYTDYFFWRCMRRDVMHKDFQWEGMDGTQMTAHWISSGYAGLFFDDDAVENAEEQHFVGASRKELHQLMESLRQYGDDEIFLIPNGGDFRMPQRSAPKRLRALAKEMPGKLQFGTPSDYAKAIDTEKLPVVQGEFNGAFQGTYSTNVWIKQRTSAARVRLLALEKEFAVTGGIKAAVDWPALWKKVLKCQFHDTICGSICDDGVVEVENDLDSIEQMLDAAGSPRPVYLFNPLGQARRTTVEVGGTRYRAELPPLGVVALDQCPAMSAEECAGTRPAEYENAFYRCRTDANGCLISLRRNGGEELIAPGERFGILSMQFDHGDNWLNFRSPLDGGCFEASLTDNRCVPWKMPHEPLLNNSTVMAAFHSASLIRREGGMVIRQTGEVQFWRIRMTFETEIILDDDSPLIRYRTKMTPDAKHVRLMVAFPTAIKQGKIHHAIPFGIQERGRFELPSEGYFDYRDGSKGVTILSRGIPACGVDEENVMLITLFRAVAMEYKCESDKSFNRGRKMVFEYAVLPCSGDWSFTEAAKISDEYTYLPVSCDRPAALTFAQSLPDGVRISALKRTAHGAWFVRLAETAGRPVECVWNLPPEWTQCAAADGLERATGAFEACGEAFALSLRPFEIKNYLFALHK